MTPVALLQSRIGRALRISSASPLLLKLPDKSEGFSGKRCFGFERALERRNRTCLHLFLLLTGVLSARPFRACNKRCWSWQFDLIHPVVLFSLSLTILILGFYFRLYVCNSCSKYLILFSERLLLELFSFLHGWSQFRNGFIVQCGSGDWR